MVAVSLAVALAVGAVVTANREADKERQALILFVCAAVEIQERGPLGPEYRRRFGDILADLGENPCKEE